MVSVSSGITEASPDESARASRRITISSQILLLLPVVVATVMAWQRRWVTDDGFINFRIVDQLLAGNGPVFNVGERVEAATSTLWLFVLALFEWLPTPLEIEWWSVLLGIAFLIAGLIAAERGALILLGRSAEKAIAVPLGAVIFVVLPPAWDFTTSGLEGGLSFGWIGVAFYMTARMARQTTTRFTIATALVVSLGPLVRPDLALISAAFGVSMLAILWRSWRQVATVVVVALALPVAYQIFRMGYFAALAPNTALAKEASLTRIDQGLRYLDDFVSHYWLVVPLAISAVVGVAIAPWRERRIFVVWLMPFVAGIVHTMYIVKVGGDYMHGRMLLPSLFVLLCPLMAVWMTRRVAMLTGAICVWAIICATSLRVPYGGWSGVAGTFSDERVYYSEVAQVEHPVTVDDYRNARWVQWGEQLEQIAASGDRVYLYQNIAGGDYLDRQPLRADVSANVVALMGNVGLYGYTSGVDVTIADPAGLADPVASRLLLTERGRPGHEKGLHPLWFRTRFADPSALDTDEYRAAANTLNCGDMRLVLRATTDPLTPRLFLSNIRHSASYWHVRMPNDPFAAERKFCEGR